MKLVTFARDMAPHGAGDTRLVPDDVAVALEKEDALSDSKPWPPTQSAAAPERPKRPTLQPTRPTGGASPRVAR